MEFVNRILAEGETAAVTDLESDGLRYEYEALPSHLHDCRTLLDLSTTVSLRYRHGGEREGEDEKRGETRREFFSNKERKEHIVRTGVGGEGAAETWGGESGGKTWGDEGGGETWGDEDGGKEKDEARREFFSNKERKEHIVGTGVGGEGAAETWGDEGGGEEKDEARGETRRDFFGNKERKEHIVGTSVGGEGGGKTWGGEGAAETWGGEGAAETWGDEGGGETWGGEGVRMRGGVIVGEGESGKTCLVEMLAGTSTERRPVRAFRLRWYLDGLDRLRHELEAFCRDDAAQAERASVIFDGLDENEEAVKVIVEFIVTDARRRNIGVWVTSRRRGVVSQLLRVGLKPFVLLPFSHGDIRRLVELNGLDPEAFFAMLRRNRLVPLAAKPGGAAILIDLFKREDVVFLSRPAMMDLIVRSMARGTRDGETECASECDLADGEIVAAAEWMAVRLVFSGKDSFWDGTAVRCPPVSLSFEEVRPCGGVTRDAIRAVLSRRLIEPMSLMRYRFTGDTRTVPYLVADWLVTHCPGDTLAKALDLSHGVGEWTARTLTWIGLMRPDAVRRMVPHAPRAFFECHGAIRAFGIGAYYSQLRKCYDEESEHGRLFFFWDIGRVGGCCRELAAHALARLRAPSCRVGEATFAALLAGCGDETKGDAPAALAEFVVRKWRGIVHGERVSLLRAFRDVLAQDRTGKSDAAAAMMRPYLGDPEIARELAGGGEDCDADDGDDGEFAAIVEEADRRGADYALGKLIELVRAHPSAAAARSGGERPLLRRVSDMIEFLATVAREDPTADALKTVTAAAAETGDAALEDLRRSMRSALDDAEPMRLAAGFTIGAIQSGRYAVRGTKGGKSTVVRRDLAHDVDVLTDFLLQCIRTLYSMQKQTDSMGRCERLMTDLKHGNYLAEKTGIRPGTVGRIVNLLERPDRVPDAMAQTFWVACTRWEKLVVVSRIADIWNSSDLHRNQPFFEQPKSRIFAHIAKSL